MLKAFVLFLIFPFILGSAALAEEKPAEPAGEKPAGEKAPVEEADEVLDETLGEAEELIERAKESAGGLEGEDLYADLELFANALTIIDAHFVETKSSKDLVYGALKGMLRSLDPYSQFLDPEAYQEIKAETEGQFGGIGVEISFRDGILTVISPVDDTPAARAGLQPEDKIVRIDGESTRDLDLDDAVKKLRGRPGSKVELTVLREEEGRLIDLTLERDIIKVKSIRDVSMIDEDVGYIRLSEFQENTPRDLRKALKDLEAQGMKGLVFDLRNNPGGLLPVAIKVSEEFVPRGKLVVYTEGRNVNQNFRFMSEGTEKPLPYPVVVLVNQGSASASEIVAGALQDHRLGIIMGTKTFGKGSVQTVVPLRDGSAIRLTTSQYFTPAGRLIHGTGIEPDVQLAYQREEKSEKEAEEEESKRKVSAIFERVELRGEKEGEQVGLDLDAKKAWDNQVMGAVRLIHALRVYDERFSKGEDATS